MILLFSLACNGESSLHKMLVSRGSKSKVLTYFWIILSLMVGDLIGDD